MRYLSRFGKIISLLILILLINLFCHLTEAVIIDRIVAIVNNDIITLSDLQIKQYVLESSTDTGYPENPIDEKVLLENLIEETLQIQEARKYGYKIPPEQIEDAITNICIRHNISTIHGLEKELMKQKMTIQSFRKQIEKNLLVKKIINREIQSKIIRLFSCKIIDLILK